MLLSATDRHQRRRTGRSLAVPSLLALVLMVAGCAEGAASSSTTGEPVVAVTTSIWADVVSTVACGGPVEIRTVMPIGSDAHTFEPSLADRALFEDASLVVSNGISLEVGLLDTIAEAEAAGVPVLRLGQQIDTIPYGGASGHDHDDDDDADHDDDDADHDVDDADHDDDDADHDDDDADHDDDDADHDDDDEADHDEPAAHNHDGDDPHVWFDPIRTSAMLPILADRLVEHVGLDRDEVDGCVESYQNELAALDADIAGRVAALPAERRLLVTNHDTLGYFADRYDLEVIGTVSTTPSGLSETNPADLEALAQAMEESGSRTIFAETSASVDEAEALARRLGDAQVVTLFTESLGEPGSEADTYAGLLSTNADLILDALS